MRKTAELIITDDNRDKGKKFIITEKSAFEAERWAMRALLALGNAGVDVPEDMANAGMAGLASFGINLITKLDYDIAEPLLNEMMECVQIDMGNGIVRKLVEGEGADIEEVKTRLLLRKAVLELHMGFSFAANQLTSV